MFNKPVEDLEESDLQFLLDHGVYEQRTLEYKLIPRYSLDEERKEFLADVSSFANSSGGYLLIGIKEAEGRAVELPGVGLMNPDAETLKIESILRDGIQPRIPGIAVKPVLLSSGKFILVLHIPKSWAAPHMITLKSWSRFYARNSAGKYMLDVNEIRSAFAISVNMSQYIRDFRVERISKILNGDITLKLANKPKTVLHIIPLSAFGTIGNQVNLNDLRQIDTFKPIGHDIGYSYRVNMEGMLAYEADSEDRNLVGSYVQVFRQGIIEAVDTNSFQQCQGVSSINSVLFERDLIQATAGYLQLLKLLKVGMPVVLLLSVLDVKGYVLAITSQKDITRYPIDRDHLIINEILIENYAVDASQVLRTAFDAVWNAGGIDESLNYKNGIWCGQG